MRIAAEWIARPETQAVCAALTGAGHRALFVGGCVRNALLYAPVSDVDIATDARPERVMELALAAGLKPVPTGIAHGTVTVIASGLPYEVTTFRRDVATDGRHAEVAFSEDLAEDAARRDFTMNALYATPEGAVIDPLGYLADLEARHLRFVGQAEARIAEDYLRILRFFRFHAWYADPAEGFDPEALAACAAGAEGIERLSRERIGAEMRKLLSAPDPVAAVAVMAQAGILARVLPGSDAKALPILLHLEGDLPADWQRRLAALGGMDVANHLRLSRDEARRQSLIREEICGGGATELGYRHGVALARDILLVRGALLETELPPGWSAQVEASAAAQFPVSARDLMPAYSGPAQGRKLAELEARWIASGFTLGREDLLA